MQVEKSRRLCLPLSWRSLHSFMQCFDSCQFFLGSWIGTSDEVANIHIKTDAKNLFRTARTFHLLEQKNHPQEFQCFERKFVQGVFMIFAHIPTQKCLPYCLTEASAKAGQLDVIAKTGMLLDVDIHLDCRTFMEILPSYLCGVVRSSAQGKRYFL